MLTQTELYNNDEFITRWIYTDPEQSLKRGQKLGLMEDPARIWLVGRTFLTLHDEKHLPAKAKTSTILAFLEDDGKAELDSVYPRIFAV